MNPVTFSNQSFTAASLQVTGLTVENGAAERSYIRYLDVNFNESDAQSGGQLTTIAGSLGTAVQLYRYDLNGDASSKTAVPLSGVTATVIDHAIELDFGTAGLGGNANTTAGDGYYELDVTVGGTTVQALLLPAAGRRDRRRRGGQQRPERDRDRADPVLADGLQPAERRRQRRRVGHGDG